MQWLYSIINSMDMNLCELQEIVEDGSLGVTELDMT